MSIGAEYADKELPFVHHATGKTEKMRMGNYLNALTGHGVRRENEKFYILFYELLPFLLIP